MDRRKPIFVNEYEEATDAALQDAATRSGARVFPKVRVADALEINHSGLTDAEYSYALKAHFDFIVVQDGKPPAFAVEFDGPGHSSDVSTIVNDNLKNSICEKLEMPLLRIDSGYLRRVGRFTLVGWLAEVWFLSEDFYAAQDRGEVPPYEPFCWFAILGDFDFEKKRFMPPPYDPFVPSRARIFGWFNKKLCGDSSPTHLRGLDPTGYYTAIAHITARNGDVIVGVARCKDFNFREVTAPELAEELSTVDLAEKFQMYLDGEYNPQDFDEVEVWRHRMAKWSRRSE